MSSENKAQRALARQLSRAKDRRKRRRLVSKKQTDSVGISKEEFEKTFPHLPLKLWYAQKNLTRNFCYEI